VLFLLFVGARVRLESHEEWRGTLLNMILEPRNVPCVASSFAKASEDRHPSPMACHP
jgi:hypothetical protein